MKKTGLTLSLLLGLVATSLAGCDNVTKKKDDGKEVLFTVSGENITADDLLGFDGGTLSYDFLQTDEGVEAVYNAIYNALAQKNVAVNKSVEAVVDEKMEDWKEEVKDYASANGVTERNAKKTKLEQLGFDDEKQFQQCIFQSRRIRFLWQFRSI